MRIENLLSREIVEETLRGMELKRDLTTNSNGEFTILGYDNGDGGEFFIFIERHHNLEYIKSLADMIANTQKEYLGCDEIDYFVYNSEGEIIYVGDEESKTTTMN